MYTENNPGCCAIDDIFELSLHVGDPEGAMKTLCKAVRSYNGTLRLPAFYIFSGVERCTGDKYDDDDYIEPDQLGYGSEFAAYIRKHRLGVLRESPARKNRLNHETHIDKVWLWAPSELRLNAWWKEHGGK